MTVVSAQCHTRDHHVTPFNDHNNVTSPVARHWGSYAQPALAARRHRPAHQLISIKHNKATTTLRGGRCRLTDSDPLIIANLPQYPQGVWQLSSRSRPREQRSLLLFYGKTKEKSTGSSAVAETKPIARYCLEWPCSRLTMAIPVSGRKKWAVCLFLRYQMSPSRPSMVQEVQSYKG